MLRKLWNYLWINIKNINLGIITSRNLINKFKFTRKWSKKVNWVRENDWIYVKLKIRNLIIESTFYRKCWINKIIELKFIRKGWNNFIIKCFN